ncbi:MAG: hypothetical protein AAGF49_08880, partial [Pseudomonadota bacterium]
VLNLRQLLTRWRDGAGKDNITVRPFARELMAGGDVIDDVLDILGCGDAAAELTRAQLNEPLSAVAAHLLDRAQRIEPKRRMDMLSRRAFEAIGGPRYVLPPAAVEQVRQRSAEHLAFLREEFGIVLPEPAPSEHAEPELTPEVMETLSETLYTLTQYALAVERSPAARLLGMRSPFSQVWDTPPHRWAPLLERLGIKRRMMGPELRGKRRVLRQRA